MSKAETYVIMLQRLSSSSLEFELRLHPLGFLGSFLVALGCVCPDGREIHYSVLPLEAPEEQSSSAIHSKGHVFRRAAILVCLPFSEGFLCSVLYRRNVKSYVRASYRCESNYLVELFEVGVSM